MTQAASPLAGIKILDLSQIMAGPYCTMVLADLGAEVIKVEKTGAGDDSREMGPYLNGESTCFAQINRNKQGVALNLKDPEAREVLYELARWADVVVENYRVGVTKSLGVDYETLSRINPRLVYCSISGYGHSLRGQGRLRPGGPGHERHHEHDGRTRRAAPEVGHRHL
jgi:crotonobetainyl-CoA:carnitine CoA-transferase CaiB-like acyl-CoA transferase